jgi:hypothetical protein
LSLSAEVAYARIAPNISTLLRLTEQWENARQQYKVACDYNAETGMSLNVLSERFSPVCSFLIFASYF